MSYTQVPSIGYPAPDFECMALVGPNEFKALKLSDYKGKWVGLLPLLITLTNSSGCPFLLSFGFHLCLPDRNYRF
jgi:hypothetical protein